jgi:peroxiredoxin
VRSRLRGGALAAVLASALALTLAACSQPTDLDDGDYVSGDGSILTIAPENRADPVAFGGTTDTGDEVSSDDLVGDVVVLNFWYANCPPCRLEAPDLEALHREFADSGVVFLGVNVRDSADKARVFAEEFGITYPSLLDAEDRAITSAFAGDVPPSAVPTTLVLDREGRVAARFTGLIESPGTVADVLEAALGEAP